MLHIINFNVQRRRGTCLQGRSLKAVRQKESNCVMIFIVLIKTSFDCLSMDNILQIFFFLVIVRLVGSLKTTDFMKIGRKYLA